MTRISQRLLALFVAGCLALTGITQIAPRAAAATGTVTNLAHLDFLLDTVRPGAVPGHTTYRLDTQPDLTMPWTYADARPGGTFQRIGGGYDPVTGTYSQGAFNTDDIARAAVVYLRHWRLTGSPGSRTKAYQLLRSVAYMQTTTGPNAGRSVLWMQPGGELNPSAKPVELPDPSDSGPSYWQARTMWAFGEGYAAFARSEPAFAQFLQARLQLSLRALNRDVLSRYGQHLVADGVRLPAWLIVNGADATAEATLGLSAYVTAAPGDRAARRALAELAEGIAQMSAGDAQHWPYGAILPWAESRSMWHAWSSQMAAGLARSAGALHRPRLLVPAVGDSFSFEPTLLTAGGPDNGWYPTPTDRTQIAYGADSRVQNLLAVAEVGRLQSARDLAALQAAWFFGANRTGQPIYDRATGVTYDGISPDGTINRNSGAESTIHGLLTMIALDSHPAVRDRARTVATVQARDGLSVVQGEAATSTTGTVVKPASDWTGESVYGGGQYLALEPGQHARYVLPAARWPRLEPVSWLEYHGTAVSRWREDGRRLGRLRLRVGAQGVTAVPGALLPQELHRNLTRSAGTVRVTAARDTVRLDALIVRPLVSRLQLGGSGHRTELVHSAATHALTVPVGRPGVTATVRVYDARGQLTSKRRISGRGTVWLPAAGLAVVVS